jgi:hypothetical protein
MINPKTPARRSLFRMTPTRLRINPSGVATMIANPPRVAMADPQPGLASHTTTSAPREASENHSPIRPKPAFRSVAGSAWIIGGSSMLKNSKLHFQRLADRLQRLEVELDGDADFLFNQSLGYSP